MEHNPEGVHAQTDVQRQRVAVTDRHALSLIGHRRFRLRYDLLAQ